MRLALMNGEMVPREELRSLGFEAVQVFFGHGSDGAKEDPSVAAVDGILEAGDTRLAAMTLHVDLVGVVSNTSAIGARVRVVAGGSSQIREVSGGSGLYSQNSLTAEFGLSTATSADSLEICWPSGIVDRRTNLTANQKLSISSGCMPRRLARCTHSGLHFGRKTPIPAVIWQNSG